MQPGPDPLPENAQPSRPLPTFSDEWDTLPTSEKEAFIRGALVGAEPLPRRRIEGFEGDASMLLGRTEVFYIQTIACLLANVRGQTMKPIDSPVPTVAAATTHVIREIIGQCLDVRAPSAQTFEAARVLAEDLGTLAAQPPQWLAHTLVQLLERLGDVRQSSELQTEAYQRRFRELEGAGAKKSAAAPATWPAPAVPEELVRHTGAHRYTFNSDHFSIVVDEAGTLYVGGRRCPVALARIYRGAFDTGMRIAHVAKEACDFARHLEETEKLEARANSRG